MWGSLEFYHRAFYIWKFQRLTTRTTLFAFATTDNKLQRWKRTTFTFAKDWKQVAQIHNKDNAIHICNNHQQVTKINNKDNIICICKVQTIGALSFPFVKINKGIITMWFAMSFPFSFAKINKSQRSTTQTSHLQIRSTRTMPFAFAN